jgi:HD-GYP domain-containing protein (c-di-GMP phosphodiesterase class II)
MQRVPSSPTPQLAGILRIFSRAGDLGRGQPEGHVEQVCWIGMRLADALKLPAADHVDTYFTTLLVHCGCTAGMAEFATFIASDELAAQRDFCLCAPENVVEVFRCMKRNIAPEASLPRRIQGVIQMLMHGEKMTASVQGGCADVGSRIANRLGLPQGAVTALGCICETWNGRGPRRLKRNSIPIVARVAHAAMVAAVFYREGGRDVALSAVGRRAGKSLDPDVVRAFTSLEADAVFWERLQASDLAETVAALEPQPLSSFDSPNLDAVTLAVADFVDLKSTRTAAHSRATADLAGRMARRLGVGEEEIALCRRAGLVHDLGQVGVSAWVLDGHAQGPAERAQLELHPQLTQRLLSLLPALREIATVAAAHHERLDGTGYPHGLTAEALPRAARILAVADEYDEIVRGTHGRPALTGGEALKTIEAGAGTRFDRDCTRALRDAIADAPPLAERGSWPAALTDREVEVLRLAARGFTLKEIARDLSVSPHTARHHLEHVYEKIGTSSRAGATLFAVEHDLVD